ncbi:MAG: hypothetical protein ACLQVX_20555 [Limisphaerales bacterium]
MKKLIIWTGIGIVAVVVLAGLAVHFFLDIAIKKGVETIGPRLAKVDVRLDSASLSILSGTGKIRGLVVGNPEGFQTRSAIHVGFAGLAVQPSSIFSDKVVIRSVKVQGPDVTLEESLHGSNLRKLLKNLKAASSADKKTGIKDDKPGKKLQVDEFVVTGGKIHVSFVGLAGRTVNLPLPDIRLENLGTGPEGITAGELTEKVLTEVLDQAIKASAGAVADLGKDAANMTKEMGNSAARKAARGLGSLFKGKREPDAK